MRVWRSPSVIVADLGPTTQPVLHTLTDELPDGPWRELREFVSLDPAGNVLHWYRVSVWSLDDDLGVSTHAVIAGELRNLTVIIRSDVEVRRKDEVILTGLQVEFDTTFVQDALARHDRLEEDEIARQQAEGEARVAAIPGALEDFGLAEPYQRARRALAKRVRVFGDPLEVELLRTLAAFGRLHQARGSQPAFAAAFDAYVAACRLAAFDPGPAVKPYSGPGIDVPELRDALGDLERGLLDAAVRQEEADAWLNGKEFRRAAGHLARVRAILGQ